MTDFKKAYSKFSNKIEAGEFYFQVNTKPVPTTPTTIKMQLLSDNNTTTHEINIELVNLESTADLFGRIRKLKRDLKHIRILGVQESIIRTSTLW